MIYRNSQDPVLLKKINIDIWLLRDELEYIVMSRLKNNPDQRVFNDLYEEFSPKKTPKLKLLKNNETEENPTKSDGQSDSTSDESLDESPESDVNKPKDENKKEVIVQRIPQLPSEQIYAGRTFLAEIYMNKILFFSNKQFTEGQSIVLSFDIPEKFILNAEVTFSQSYSLKNRILSETNLPYRICAHFSFLRQGERTLLRNFLEKIEYHPEMVPDEFIGDDEEDDISEDIQAEDEGDETSFEVDNDEVDSEEDENDEELEKESA